MIALWHFLTTFFTLFIILGLTGALSYVFMIVPGLKAYALPTLVCGVVLAGGWYWHQSAVTTAENKMRAAWAESDQRNEASWTAKVRELDNATHAKEVIFTAAVTTINQTKQKEIDNVKARLATALASNGVFYDNAARTSADARQTKTDSAAGVGDGPDSGRISDEARTFLLKESALADQTAVQLGAAQGLINEFYKACSN